MKTLKDLRSGRNGTTLVVVMCLILVSAGMTASVVYSTGARSSMANRQVNMERAFFVAEGGAERAAAYVAAGNEDSIELSGSLGEGSYVANVISSGRIGGEIDIDIVSVGTVNGVSRTVTMHGVRRLSWARYALWYEKESTTLWIVPGEIFSGRVYSKPQLHFHDTGLAADKKNQVLFTDRVWTSAKTIEKKPKAEPIFEKGIVMNAPIESMASVDFSTLLTKADTGTDRLVLEGETEIILSGSTIKITNARKGWTNKTVPRPSSGLIYAATKTVTTQEPIYDKRGRLTGYSTTTKTYPGDITIRAPAGLTGRLTLVAENDITIQDHVRYTTEPQAHPESTDALGLIAQKSVEVGLDAPKNLNIYAHIICKEGSFGVKNYNSGSSRGTLFVYGGIVNQMRSGVGTVGGGTGYSKSYWYDTRFAKNPPPCYPELPDEIEWTEWEG